VRALAATALALTGALLFSSCATEPQLPKPIQKQIDYAFAHWNKYNDKTYGDLNPVGGDCANFVSQTLIARGWKMNDQWYNHDAAADWSPAWGYVPAMDNYFRANAKTLGLVEYPLSKRAKLQVGDIVMFDWNDNASLDHVEIVSKIETVDDKIVVKMAGHNKDTKYRDLDTVLKKEPGTVGHFWHIKLPPTATPTPSS
jgi:uncharacterized protein YijF (DUF1287 family)